MGNKKEKITDTSSNPIERFIARLRSMKRMAPLLSSTRIVALNTALRKGLDHPCQNPIRQSSESIPRSRQSRFESVFVDPCHLCVTHLCGEIFLAKVERCAPVSDSFLCVSS